MKVRLGFSVAAHFEPEILIIDEVLAVGDAAFQKKCLGKMQDVAQGGRTVLFVSHSMNAVAQLTHRCLLLDGGRVAFDGPTDQAIQHYVGTKAAHMWNGRMPTKEIACDARFRGNFPAWMNEIGLGTGQGEELPMGGSFKLEVAIEAHAGCEGLRFAWTVNTPAGQPALTGISKPFDVPAGHSICEVQIDRINLVPGEYDMSLHFGTGGVVEARSEWDCLVGFGHLVITERDGQKTVFAGHWDRRFGPTVHENVRVRLSSSTANTEKEGTLT
jgi:hypothetical protein